MGQLAKRAPPSEAYTAATTPCVGAAVCPFTRTVDMLLRFLCSPESSFPSIWCQSVLMAASTRQSLGVGGSTQAFSDVASLCFPWTSPSLPHFYNMTNTSVFNRDQAEARLRKTKTCVCWLQRNRDGEGRSEGEEGMKCEIRLWERANTPLCQHVTNLHLAPCIIHSLGFPCVFLRGTQLPTVGFELVPTASWNNGVVRGLSAVIEMDIGYRLC